MSDNLTKSNIDKLETIKTVYVDESLNWYKSRVSTPRLLFRISGTLLIITSLSIPFLINITSPEYRIIAISTAGFLTALLTSLNSFYGWQSAWQKYITSQLLIEGFIVIWEIEMIAAQTSANGKSEELALKATQKLVNQTKTVVIGEAARYFDNIKWPEIKNTDN